jgi:hypothetical protein
MQPRARVFGIACAAFTIRFAKTWTSASSSPTARSEASTEVLSSKRARCGRATAIALRTAFSMRAFPSRFGGFGGFAAARPQSSS